MYRVVLPLALVPLLGCNSGLQTADELGQTSQTGSGFSCASNARPTLSFSVEDGAVHPADSPFTVVVSDDQDAPETLQVAWSTDLEGPQPAVVASPEGIATLPVEALLGDRAITVAVTDRCGAVTTAALGACLQGELHEPDLDPSTLRLSGDASIDPATGWLDLNQPMAAQVGSAFADARAVPAGDVTVRIRFTTGAQVGGDGMSITAADADRLLSWYGGGGCGLGYGASADCDNGLPIPGWSLELDFFGNDHDPVDGPHVAFTLDGALDAPIAWAAVPDVRGLGMHELELVLGNGQLTVDLDSNRVLSAPIDRADTDFNAFLGFTAGTGNSWQIHRISEIETRALACDGP